MSTADVRTVPRFGLGLSSVVSVLAVAVAYIVFARLGLSLAFATKQVTAVWPPTGIALSALLLGGYRLWPGVWIGAVEHASGLVKVEVDWRGVNPVLTILDAGPSLLRFLPSLPSAYRELTDSQASPVVKSG
jgi:hypothetical protein